MITFSLPIGLILLHFIGDFILQSNWMALGKSKSIPPLTFHVLVYSLVFLPFYGFHFWIVTFYLHWIVDFITSRITSKLWFIDLFPTSCKPEDADPNWSTYYAHIRENKRHWFFVMIGFDQLIHYVCLGLTLKYIS